MMSGKIHVCAYSLCNVGGGRPKQGLLTFYGYSPKWVIVSKSQCSTDPSLGSDLLQVLQIQKVTHFLAPYLEIHPSIWSHFSTTVLHLSLTCYSQIKNTPNRKQGSTVTKCLVSLVQVWGKKCYSLVSYICVNMIKLTNIPPICGYAYMIKNVLYMSNC